MILKNTVICIKKIKLNSKIFFLKNAKTESLKIFLKSIDESCPVYIYQKIIIVSKPGFALAPNFNIICILHRTIIIPTIS